MDAINNDAGNEREVARQLLENMENLSKSNAELAETVESMGSTIKASGIDNVNVNNVVEEFNELRNNVEAMKEAQKQSPGYIDGLDESEGQFSLIKAMTAIRTNNWEKAGFERSVFEAARTKAQATNVDSAGGYFVPDQVIPDVISAIYANSVVVNQGGDGETRASVLDGLSGGTVKIPKFQGGTVAYWIGEEDTYAESQTKVGDVTMTPKKLGVLVRLTDEMRRLGGYGFESLLRNDMVRAAAKKIDYACLYGTGMGSSPRGIMGAVTQQAHVDFASDGDINAMESPLVFKATADDGGPLGLWTGAEVDNAADTEIDFDALMEMVGLLEDNDIMPDASAALISSPRFMRRLKKQRAGAGGDDGAGPYLGGAPFLSDEALRSIIGDFGVSSQVRSNQTAGASLDQVLDPAGTPTASADTDCGDVFYGNWGEMVFGRWGGIEIEDDAGRGSGFTSDHLYLKMRLYCDVGLRHPQSFVVCTEAKTS
tara:strand:+ start:207 stop:1658 length:1452 start_codon:yes stop_codon:yes gene_type:complete